MTILYDMKNYHKNLSFQRTRKHSSRMHTDRAITRPSSESVSMRPIVDRQTPVKTLPSLAVGNKEAFQSKCNSMPFGAAWAYYGKVLVLASAAP